MYEEISGVSTKPPSSGLGPLFRKSDIPKGGFKWFQRITKQGIGGLVLAIAIEKFAQHDVQIDVYESHDAITTAGAGISIASRAAEIMQELGMYK
ncbi:hypothetical protein AZE42_09720 [Rhizopogon vesiculosus]|uniref:Uncharacterized protein n=1 Tax=Rhizopogon vesiculosus TaxID=180088 RepID=A0A1J8QSW9_9AGAM|nr:hypothetical protein AZE42_09720 [Rhizopogon vesiculosus]